MCVCVCVSVCVHTITFDQNDLGPRCLACWFILTLSTSNSRVVIIIDQSSQSQGEKCYFSRLRIQSIDCKVKVKLGKPVTVQCAGGNDTVPISVWSG